MTTPPTDDPWKNLTRPTDPGSVTRLRIDGDLPRDLFWGFDHQERKVLILQTSGSLPGDCRIPRFREVELKQTRNQATWAITLTLRDPEKSDLFRVFCDDLVETVGMITSEQDAALRFIERSRRWHLLLRGGGGILGEQAQRGLVAELVFLCDHVIEHLGPTAGIAAWDGPLGKPQDFQANNHRIEVKATSNKQPFSFKVSSEQQLDPNATDGDRLWLAMLEVTRRPADIGQGDTLPELVESIRNRLGVPDQAVSRDFEQRLLAASYEDLPDYEGSRWQVAEPIIVPVTASFPSLQGSKLRNAISQVRYTCDLSGESLNPMPNPLAP